MDSREDVAIRLGRIVRLRGSPCSIGGSGSGSFRLEKEYGEWKHPSMMNMSQRKGNPLRFSLLLGE